MALIKQIIMLLRSFVELAFETLELLFSSRKIYVAMLQLIDELLTSFKKHLNLS